MPEIHRESYQKDENYKERVPEIYKDDSFSLGLNSKQHLCKQDSLRISKEQ